MKRVLFVLLLFVVFDFCLGDVESRRLVAAGQEPAEKTLFDMSAFEGQVLKPEVTAGPTPLTRPFFIMAGNWGYNSGAKKADAFGPGAVISGSPTPQMATIQDVKNFRLSLFVSSAGLPVISFRCFVREERYHLDIKEGILTRIAEGEEKVLARASAPFFSAEKIPFIQLEITAIDQHIRIRRTVDGKRWETLIECDDPKPLDAGVIMVGADQPTMNTSVRFGDIVVSALPEAVCARAARIMDRDELIRMALPLAGTLGELSHERHRILRYLLDQPSPLPDMGRLMLAIIPNRGTSGRSGEGRDIQFAALRVITKHKLSLDVPKLLLDGLDAKHQNIREAAIEMINQLKIDPERVVARAADLLLKPYPIDRNLAMKLIWGRQDVTDMAARLCKEVERRYKAAKDPKERLVLVRALSNAEFPESVEFQLRCLDDPDSKVRQMALRNLRFYASMLMPGNKWRKDVYTQNPALVDKVYPSVRAVLKNDPSAICRAEAAGCLAEIRLAPELVIAALFDRDAKVRSMAAQGLCSFDRKQVESAVARLEQLRDDPDCGADAAATLDYIMNPYKEPTLERKATTPDEILAETRRNVHAAAKATIAKTAEEGSLMGLCLAQLMLGRNVDDAAERLARGAWYNVRIGISGSLNFLGHPLFNPKDGIYPDRITQEQYEQKKWSLFQYLDFYCPGFETNLQDVRVMFGSENAQVTFRAGAFLFFSGFLKDDPDYAQRKLRNGMTIAETYERWNDWMKKYIRYKALNGLWYELGANYMGRYSIWPFIAMSRFAPDPEIRQLAKMLVDLTFIDDAQCSFGYVRGGGKSRIKTQGIYGSLAAQNMYLYEGRPYGDIGLILAASGYEAPDVAVLLHRLKQFPEKPIEIINQRFAETRGPVKHCYVADSRVYNYSYKTRNYMLGAALRHPMLRKGFDKEKDTKGPYGSIDNGYQQAQWNGLVFFDGSGLFTVSSGYVLRYYSFQHKNVWLLQPYGDDDLYLYTDPKFKRVEEDGWAFLNNGDRAYAAIKCVKLKEPYTWEEHKDNWFTTKPRGKVCPGMFLVLKPKDNPYIIQAGDVDEYGSFEGFKAAVKKNKIKLSDESIKYFGPRQDTIEMFFQKPVDGEMVTDKVSLVNGKPFDYERPMVYDSPFMKRNRSENIVTVRAGNREAVYDFDKATVKTKVIGKE